MKTFRSQNLHLPDSNDLNAMQDFKSSAIKDRITDSRSWGVLRSNAYPAIVDIPASATDPAPNLLQAFGEFTVAFDTQFGRLSVGAGANSSLNPKVVGGVAYDLNGERIYIPEDLAFDFSNAIPEGLRSSGNLQIPLTLSGTSGGSGTNASVLGTYYLWIEYLQVNDPNEQKVARDGTIFYPEMLDGYKLVLTADPVAPSGDGVSIFLAKIVWAVSFPEVLSVTDGEIVRTNGNKISTIPTDVVGEPKRIYSLIRDNQVEAILDTDNPTMVYAAGQRATLGDHVRAFGSTTPTQKNPHGLTLGDIPGGTDEPKATANQSAAMAKGIVDLTQDVDGNYNVPENSPASQSTALIPTNEAQTLTPVNLDANTILGSGITSSTKDAWVRVGYLKDGQYAFLQGNRLTSIYPTLRQSDLTGDSSIDPSNPNSGDGWVGFSNSGTPDPAGQYRIFGSVALLNSVPVLLLRKELLSAFPDISPIDKNFLPIALVYWDGNDLFFDPTKNPNSDPLDIRSLGLVGPMQISTEGKKNVDTGILSKQTFDNQAANSNFALALSDVTTSGLGASSIIPSSTGTPAQVTSGTDPDLITQVGALTGLKFTTNAAQTGTSRIYLALAELKPARYYGISLYYKAAVAFNARMKIGISDGAGVSPVSKITTEPVDVLLKNDVTYHRLSLVVKTLDDVDPSGTAYLELRFDNGADSLQAAAFTITNIMVTEGEWIPGYSNGRQLRSGAIFMWDQTASCPPGSVVVSGLAGRAPYGVGGGVALGASSVNLLNPAVPTVQTTSVTVVPLSEVNDVPGGGNRTLSDGDQPKTHSHTVDAKIPYYGLIFCREL